VDSFDTHAKVNEHFAALDDAAQKSGNIALLSVGWDPGLFSLNRLFGETILPEGKTYTFWGKGLSQGHSDAVRGVAGVKKGVQYTLPSESGIARVRNGEQPELTTREKHVRECFVVLHDGADAGTVRNNIVTMPDCFEPFNTVVNFVDEATLAAEHNAMPHGGFVIRSGATGTQSKQTIKYSLALGSNPEFTASVLVAYARAVYRLARSGEIGTKTVFDVALGLLSPKSPSQLRKELL
jgi:diaminopimelate dehydrogenase